MLSCPTPKSMFSYLALGLVCGLIDYGLEERPCWLWLCEWSRHLFICPIRHGSSRGPTVIIWRWCATAIGPPYWGKPSYSFQVMTAAPQSRQAISASLCRDTAIPRPPHGERTPTAVLLFGKTISTGRTTLHSVCIFFQGFSRLGPRYST